MDATTEKAIIRALDRAEELREQLVAFRQPSDQTKFSRLHILVDGARELAATTGTVAPVIDLENDPASEAARRLRAFVDRLIASLEERRRSE